MPANHLDTVEDSMTPLSLKEGVIMTLSLLMFGLRSQRPRSAKRQAHGTQRSSGRYERPSKVVHY